MNNQKDSVVNFLTPTKLITGSLRPKNKIIQNQSQFTHSSNKHKPPLFIDDNSKNYNSQFQRLNYGLNRSEEIIEGKPNTLQTKQPNQQRLGKNYVLENTSKTILKSEDNFKMLAQEKVETRSEDPQKSGFVLYKVEQTNQNANNEFQNPNSGNNSRVSRAQQKILKASDVKEPANKQFNQDYNHEAGTEVLANLIMQLKGVKQLIDTSLVELQYVLDNTSKFLQDIDDEYLRIKQRILDYASLVLDAGFTKYRQGMVNWTKYEDVELKAQFMIKQLEKTIKEDEIMVEEISRLSKGTKITSSKQAQLNEQIQLFSLFATELKVSKNECLSMRPHLKEDKVVNFQRAIVSLADF